MHNKDQIVDNFCSCGICIMSLRLAFLFNFPRVPSIFEKTMFLLCEIYFRLETLEAEKAKLKF